VGKLLTREIVLWLNIVVNFLTGVSMGMKGAKKSGVVGYGKYKSPSSARQRAKQARAAEIKAAKQKKADSLQTRVARDSLGHEM